MSLPNSYSIKTGAIPDYFEGILNAEAPERFSQKFLEGLGFSSTNDRQLIGILKELGFLNADGAPQDRYYSFLDRSEAKRVLAEGIKVAYSDLFAVNTSAHTLDAKQAGNKLRTLYKGDKKDTVITYIAKTFVALCDYADFSLPSKAAEHVEAEAVDGTDQTNGGGSTSEGTTVPKQIGLNSLQYHINIVLPDSRDQAVYDAIF